MKDLVTLMGLVSGKELEPHHVMVIENFDRPSHKREIEVAEFILSPYVVVNKGGWVSQGFEVQAIKHKHFEPASDLDVFKQFCGYISVLQMTKGAPVSLSFAETSAKNVQLAVLELGRQYSTVWLSNNYKSLMRVLDDVALDVVATKFDPATEEGTRNLQENRQFRVYPFGQLKENGNKLLTYLKPGDNVMIAHWNRYGQPIRKRSVSR